MEFKQIILNWLKENGIDKKVRLINSRRYGIEVRVYGEPMEIQNTKHSFREDKNQRETTETGFIKKGMSGKFSRKISCYVAINEKDFNNKKEREYSLMTIKESLN